MDYLDAVLQLVAGLVGFPAVLAAAINLAKYFGLPDGVAGTVNLAAHLAAYVGVGVLVLLGKVDLLPGIDVQLGTIANALVALLAFLVSLGNARVAHVYLRGIPLVGSTHNG